MTAYHVVEHAASVSISCNGRPAVPVTVASSSPTTDLALLETSSDLGTRSFLRLSNNNDLSLGDPVFTVGYPYSSLLGRDPKYTNGTLSALSGPGGDASFLQINAEVQSGNSGGPLVNDTGEVIGVIVSRAHAAAFLEATDSLPQNINWAVKSAFAAVLFTPPSANVTSSGSDDIITRVVEATCFVQVIGSEQ